MPTPVERIKEKIDVAELVGSYVKLQKAGVNFKALCPFHTERTPSFYVTPARQIWHCFGCNAGGDIFRFVMNIEGVEFPEALRILAEKAGIELERQDPKIKSERTRLLDLLETAAVYYEKNLLERHDVGVYLKERGMTGETAKSFRLGYAFNSWDGIINHLRQAGFKQDETEKAGLCIKSEKDAGYYDRFRARVMFPLFDGAGRIVGFSGRIFEKDVQIAKNVQNVQDERIERAKRSDELIVSQPQVAKYINTPQTSLYDKSRLLYGFDRAKTEIRKKNSAVILEGQMDLIMSHQSGVINAVAVSGTALTPHHLLNLKRLCDTLVMSFDTDSAGFEATKKSIDLAASVGFDLKIAGVSGVKDPADLIKENPENWLKAVQNARPVVSFLLETLAAKNPDPLLFKKEAGRVILPHIAFMQSEIDRAHWVGEIAGALKMREENVWQELERIKIKPRKKDLDSEQKTPVSRTRRGLLEERLMGLAVLKKSGFENVFSECKPEWFSPERRHIFESILVSPDVQDHYVKKLALEAEVVYTAEENIPGEIRDLIRELKKEHFKERLVKLSESIRGFEKSGSKDELEKSFSEFKAVSAELNLI